jgi:hypothetical protein
MPSKNGFGNSRIPLTKKVQYGVDQKNPITMRYSGSRGPSMKGGWSHWMKEMGPRLNKAKASKYKS